MITPPAPRPVGGPVAITEAGVLDLDAYDRLAAEIAPVTYNPVALADAANGKVVVPDAFTKHAMVVYSDRAPHDKGEMSGSVEFKVTRSGPLLIACFFKYQGNAGGGWQKTRWKHEEFLANGWRDLEHAQLGGPLIRGDKREQVLLWKDVKEGETYKLRCNKYEPSFVILPARN